MPNQRTIPSRAVMLPAAVLAILAMLLAACNLPSSKTPTPDAKMLITQAAMTVAVELTQSAALTPSPQPTQTTAPTNPPLPATAAVQEPTAQPKPTNTQPPASGSNTAPDSASFVADVTVPDGTGATPGAIFDKTWRIKNTGTTTWSSAYSLVWVEGEKMGSPDSVAIPKEVRPGETVDITVRLTAPTKTGTYQTYFRLRNASGQFFKLDGTGDLWVKIIVGAGATSTPDPSTATPTVTVEATP